MKKKETSNFIEPKHVKYIILFALICYICVYFCFCGKGFIPPGNELDKSDWLSFVGDFLSFIGTVAVSWAALWQTKHYNDLDERRREEERRRAVQPIFSIELFRNERHILNDSNVIVGKAFVNYITVKNVGQTPVAHVAVFNKYQTALLQPDKALDIFCIFDGAKGKPRIKNLIILTEDAFDRNEEDIPKFFNINYDDIDGRKMCQTYKLIKFDDEYIYSLEKTFEP